MPTKEIEIIKIHTRALSKEQKLELIEFLTRSLRNGTSKTKPLQFGKYASGKPLSRPDDFLIAEWRPSDLELNGN